MITVTNDGRVIGINASSKFAELREAADALDSADTGTQLRAQIRAAVCAQLTTSVQALERAQLLPPAATSDERAEQVGALLVLLATPRVAAAVRRELETILEGLAAEASPQMSQRDIELLASNEEDRKYDHGNE